MADTLPFAPNGPNEIRIACDTEFQGPHTRTTQFTARVGDKIAVQVYRSPAIPNLPDLDLVGAMPNELWSICSGIGLGPD